MDGIEELFKQAVQLHKKGELTKAEKLYNQVLNQSPHHKESLENLAAIVYNSDSQASLQLLQKALRYNPDAPSVHFNLGNIYQRHGNRDKAITCFRKVISLKPNYAEAYFRLGTLFGESGKLEDAIFCYKKAFDQNPRDVRAVNNLTEIYNRLKRYDEAEAMATKTLELAPDLAEAHGNLGIMFKMQGNYKKAEYHFKEALKSQPKNAKLMNHLGAALLFSNRPEEAVAMLQKAIEIDPDFHQAHSGYVYALNYFEEYSQQEIFKAHCEWGGQHSKGIKDQNWDWIERDPGKKLRVGFVSPDFKAHVVSLFMQQLFKNYDKDQFEFYGYAEVDNPDGYTNKFMNLLDGWRTTVGVTDEMVYETIKNDKIDILIDLAGHTTGNRLTVFTMKPAPLQVSYLGYMNTTGLNTIDYRFTDGWVDSAGSEQFYTERLYRLPNSFTCYEPIDPCPPVVETPAIKNGYITFGCFNNSNKLTPRVIKLWSRVIKAVHQSKLLIKSTNLADGDTRERFKDMFLKQGIKEDSILFDGPDEIYNYLKTYSRIDIGLDPFPHNGGTTSHDCLWMGVPMISLEGDRYVSRFGVSILNNLGYSQWIAKSTEKYVEIATDLASNVENLNSVRMDLRGKMKSSPLCDGPDFARQFGDALRAIWKEFLP